MENPKPGPCRIVGAIGTLRYEDGKARTGTAVDAGNFRGSPRVTKSKMLKMCIFAKDGAVNNSNILWTIKKMVEILSY